MRKLKKKVFREEFIAEFLSVLGLLYVLNKHQLNLNVAIASVLFFGLLVLLLRFLYFRHKDDGTSLPLTLGFSIPTGFFFATLFIYIAKMIDDKFGMINSIEMTGEGRALLYSTFWLYTVMSIIFCVATVIYRFNKSRRRQLKKDNQSREKTIQEFCSLVGISQDTYDVMYDFYSTKTIDLSNKVVERGANHCFSEKDSIFLVNMADGLNRLNENAYNYKESIDLIKTAYVELINDYIEKENQAIHEEKCLLDKENDEVLEGILYSDKN